MILKARKAGKAPFRLLPQVVLHKSPKHTADQDDYTQQLTGILREVTRFGKFESLGFIVCFNFRQFFTYL